MYKGLIQIKVVKEKLLTLSVPKEFKEMHMNLFLGINKMEEYFVGGDLENKKISKDIIDNELENNPWLNN